MVPQILSDSNLTIIQSSSKSQSSPPSLLISRVMPYQLYHPQFCDCYLHQQHQAFSILLLRHSYLASDAPIFNNNFLIRMARVLQAPESSGAANVHLYHDDGSILGRE